MLQLAFIAFASVQALLTWQAQDGPALLGIFEGQSDVGSAPRTAPAEYNAVTGTYTVSGGGENMWAASDDFHFVWKKVSAQNLTLAADVSILGAGGEGHRKGVLMVRQSLDPDSAYVDAARHGDGLTSLQFRERKGAVTREVESNVSGPLRLKLEKQGDRFYLWVGDGKGDLQFSGGSALVAFHAPFYVGIGVCAHRKDVVERAAFTHVDLNTAVEHSGAVFSTVETVLRSGDARSGYVSREHLTSPGWSADGRDLTFEIEGKRQSAPFTPLKTAAPVGEPLTPELEGQASYFASNQTGGSQIWRKPPDGGDPEQITSGEFNNAAPHLSPDGKYLVFLRYPKDLKEIPENGDVELQIMTLADKSVKTLAAFVGGKGSLGSQPWSPDGRRVVFISYRTME